MEIDREDLQKVFDCAVNSLDFGSGFLDNDEVEALRRVAELLGVDPKAATPGNFWSTYYPKHPGMTPEQVAVKAGHINVESKMTPDGMRYSCRCGYLGSIESFHQHVVSVGERAQAGHPVNVP